MSYESWRISFQSSEAAARSAYNELETIKKELERESARLVGCSVAALGYFVGCHEYYKSASLNDVLNLRKEYEALRQQLASSEPVAYVTEDTAAWFGRAKHEDSGVFRHGETYLATIPLYTHPQSASVNELVEALEQLARLGNGDNYGNSDGNVIAQEALAKYKKGEGK